MGALPKRKISKARKNRRRSHHAINISKLIPCPTCNHLKRPHEVCQNCGKYKDKQVIKAE